MTQPSKRVEEILDEYQRAEEMCDDDSDQIVAMYRRKLRTTLTQLEAEKQQAVEDILSFIETRFEDKEMSSIIRKEYKALTTEDNQK